MISELEFLAVVFLLYCFECTARVRLGDIVLSPKITFGYKITTPAQLSAGSSSGWVFFHPLWSGQPVFSFSGTHYMIAEDGVLLRDAANSEWRLIGFHQISKPSVSQCRLDLNGLGTIECLTQTEATSLLHFIDRLRRLPVGSRAREIAASESRALDTEAARKGLEVFNKSIRGLRLLSGTMFVLVFVLFPLVSKFFGIGLGILFLGAIALLTSAYSAIRYFRVLSQFDPEASGFHRVMSAVHIALYPLSVIRCPDVIALRSLRGFEAAAVSLAVGGRGLAEEAVRKCISEMSALGANVDCPPTAIALEQCQLRKIAAFREFLNQIGSNPEAVLGPPVPQSTDCHSYCPRCFTQYKIRDGLCSDCNVSLQLLTARRSGLDEMQ